MMPLGPTTLTVSQRGQGMLIATVNGQPVYGWPSMVTAVDYAVMVPGPGCPCQDCRDVYKIQPRGKKGSHPAS